MESKHSKNSRPGEEYNLIGLGGTFAGAVVLFTFGGLMVDQWLGLTPLFTLVGTGVGAVLGFLNVYWKIQAEIDKQRSRKHAQKGPS